MGAQGAWDQGGCTFFARTCHHFLVGNAKEATSSSSEASTSSTNSSSSGRSAWRQGQRQGQGQIGIQIQSAPSQSIKPTLHCRSVESVQIQSAHSQPPCIAAVRYPDTRATHF